MVMDAELKRRITCVDGSRHRAPVGEAHVAFNQLVYQRFDRFPGTKLVPEEYGFNFHLYGTCGEELYGERLVAIPQDADQWRGNQQPCDAALRFSRPILCAEFRFLRRYDDEPFWSHMNWERRVRSRFGLLVPYQMMELEKIAESRHRDRYVSILEHWGMFEMPRGFFVDLPPVLTYARRYLIRSCHSGVWTLFYSAWVAKVVAALLQEVYDRARLFWVPPTLRYYIHQMDLSTALGSPHNYEELLVLINKVDQINWNAISPRNQQRGSRLLDRSPIAKCASSGNFVFYDPCDHKECTPERAKEIADAERVIPDGHHRGYAYCFFPDVSGLQKEDYGEEDVEDDEMNCEFRQAAAGENPDSAGGPVFDVSNTNVASDSAGSGIVFGRTSSAREIMDSQMAVVGNFFGTPGSTSIMTMSICPPWRLLCVDKWGPAYRQVADQGR